MGKVNVWSKGVNKEQFLKSFFRKENKLINILTTFSTSYKIGIKFFLKYFIN